MVTGNPPTPSGRKPLRPEGQRQLSAILAGRCTPEELAAVVADANTRSVSVSAYVREATLEAAQLRAELARVTRQRDDLRAVLAIHDQRRADALALHPRETWGDESLNGERVVCGSCIGIAGNTPWPCPNAQALGADDD